ncbi:NlpC/P60 family protein [Streptosporangium saharense]|uniref:NlpC/P60 family protein n=1 Tax=Streptosporangium saharense TaxID=1706840 RepID=UPI003430D453
MATFRNLLVRLGIDFSEKGLKKAERAVGRFEKRLVGVSRIAAKGAGLASLAGGATALGAALAPASAALVAMPAVLGAVKVATGVVKVGVYGMGDAMSAVAEGDAKALEKALEKLSPNARAVVRETNKINFQSVRTAVQDKLFDGLAKQIGPVSRNLLPGVRKGMVGVAGGFNAGAKEATAFAQTPMAKGLVNKVFSTTARVMGNVSTAVQPALRGVTTLTVKSLPLAERMAGWAINGVKAAGAFLSSERGAAKLSAWAQRAGDTLAQLGRIAANLGRFLGGVFRSTKGAGDGVLVTIEQITARMATFSQSAGGQQRMAEGFRLLLDILRAVAGVLPIFLGPLGATLKIVTALPEPVRGVAVQLLAFSVVAVVLGGKLSFLFRVVTSVGGAMISAGGAAIQFGAGLLKGGAALGENASAAARAGAAVRSFGMFLWQGITATAQMVAQLSQMVGQYILTGLQATGAAIKTAAFTVAQKAAAVGSKALAAATWLVNAALRANPIGIVITLLIAIGAALVLAYKKSATFRAIVDGALRGVAAAGSWMWNNVLKPVFDFLVKTITQTVPNAFRTGVAAIGRFWDKVQDVAKKPVSFVVNTIYNGGIRRVWNWVADKVNMPQLPEIKGFARGGILPGYSRRDDQLIMARSGEGILVPEAVRSLGEGFVHRANRLKGRAAQLLGIAGDPGALGIPGFEQGGIVGWVSGFIKKGKDFFLQGLQKAARVALTPMIDLADRTIGQTGFGKLAVGVVRNTVEGVLKRFLPLENEVGGPGRRAVQLARTQLGVPYVWGGTAWGRGLDCSGLTQGAWQRAVGHGGMPRTTYTQKPWLTRISSPVPGAIGQPHPGHTYLYAGNGRIIEAPYTGARVREVGMRPTPFWGMPPKSWVGYDSGGVLPPGVTPVYNGTRRPEYVFTQRQMQQMRGGDTYYFTVQVAPTANKAEIGREIVETLVAYKKRGGKLPTP